jgi:hypothetical protein
MTPYRRYAANPRRCIHCQGTHASEDHHLSVSIPIVSNSGHTGLSPPQEQTQTNTDNNTSHKHKNTRFALPTQQSAFAASQQQQRPWPLPPRPTPPTPSRRLMPGTTPSASTRKSRTSSTTSRISASLPPHPYRPVPAQWSSKKGEAILEFLREERRQIRLLKSLLDMVDANDQELILRYEDSPVTRDEDWGAFAWGPLPQWEDPPPPPPPQE